MVYVLFVYRLLVALTYVRQPDILNYDREVFSKKQKTITIFHGKAVAVRSIVIIV